MPTVVLGVTGCIGAFKACEVLRELQRRELDVQVVMTQHATRFVAPMTFEALSHHPVFVDQFELGAEGQIQHVSLADAADLLLVAPATANLIGKLAQGIADDALSTLYLATRAPVVLAPAMNVNMFRHPAVERNLATLRGRGHVLVEPGEGYLACGWLGQGRLAEVEQIVAAALSALGRRRDLEGQTVLVTAGPTLEDLDPVRFVSNRSTGRMGFRVAEAARDRGARVILVAGPTEIEPPMGVELLRVRSAQQMHDAVLARVGGASIVVMAAAVSDYRPVQVAERKVKKSDGPLSIEMTRTPDILETLGQRKQGRFLVGFAAETEAVESYARDKLRRKNADLIVANDVSRAELGFGSESNAAVLLDPAGGRVEVPATSKRALAERLLDRVLELRRKA